MLCLIKLNYTVPVNQVYAFVCLIVHCVVFVLSNWWPFWLAVLKEICHYHWAKGRES